MAESAEENWRKLFLERLQRIESILETLRKDLETAKTTLAVSGSESKSRDEAVDRVEADIKDLEKSIRDLEKQISTDPRGQPEIEKRVKLLEETQANLMGRLTILGVGGAALTSIATALLIKALT